MRRSVLRLMGGFLRRCATRRDAVMGDCHDTALGRGSANESSLLEDVGLDFDPCDPLVLVWYSLVNVLVTSVIPVPLAGPMTGVAAVLFGLVPGMAINTVTSVVGGYLGLLAVRHGCRPCFVRALGRHRSKWEALDAAVLEQGWQISLLIRIAPVSPMVGTNILLSLTSVSVPTYLWTCAIGIIPSNLPYAYAAVLGAELATQFPPKDPVMLTVTVLGLVASLLIAWKVGMIAKRLLNQAGVGGGSSKGGNEPDMPPAHEGGGSGAEAAEDAAAAAAAEAAAERARRAGGAAGACAADEGSDVEMRQQVPRSPAADAAGAPTAAASSGHVAVAGRKKPAGAFGKARGVRAFSALEDDDGL